MKDLFKFLPQILSALPELSKYVKIIPILLLLAGLGYGAFYYFTNYKDPYKCVNNQVFEQIRVDSNVYVFKGDTCIDGQRSYNESEQKSRD
jgi:hypothetical protein